jgi:adenine/guanine phosphoribosyltransferase-like PRPP-binding protein
MVLRGTPRYPVVLFDDMMTSGSHLIAAARLLQDTGHLPIQAVVVGRAAKTQDEKTLGWEPDVLSIGREITDAGDIEW